MILNKTKKPINMVTIVPTFDDDDISKEWSESPEMNRFPFNELSSRFLKYPYRLAHRQKREKGLHIKMRFRVDKDSLAAVLAGVPDIRALKFDDIDWEIVESTDPLAFTLVSKSVKADLSFWRKIYRLLHRIGSKT